MSLFARLFGNPKPRLKCQSGGYCEIIRVKVEDGISAEEYRWQCTKCSQQYFYSDSYLNGKKVTQD